MIDDADDAGVDRRLGRMERKARLFAAHEEDFLADAGPDRIDGDERTPGRLRSGVSGWTISSVMPARFSSFRVMTTSPITLARSALVGSVDLISIFVDDADDRGVDGTVLQARRHARRAAADDEHGFADAGVDRVDRDQVVAFGLAAGIHRTNDEQLAADEARIFTRGDDGADNFREEHDSL